MFAPLFFSGVAETGAARNATVLGTGNNLKFEFLCETNFGSVITVKGDVLEDGKEIAFELPVVVFLFVVATGRTDGRFERGGFIQGAEKRELLRRRSVHKIFSEEFVAFLVDAGKAVEKVLALRVVGPLGENDVDKFVDAGALRAGGIRFRNDLIDHGDNGGVLMRIETAERVAARGMRAAKECEHIRGKRGQRSSRGKHS